VVARLTDGYQPAAWSRNPFLIGGASMSRRRVDCSSIRQAVRASTRIVRTLDPRDGVTVTPVGLCDGSTHSVAELCALPDEELVERARSGCVRAAEALLGKYRGLVEGKARTFFLAGAERDDVVQEGMIGLYKAIRDFLPEKRVAFRSFAETCVTRQIITATKMATRKKHHLLNASISLDNATDESGSSDALEVPGPRMLGGATPEQIVLGRDTAREVNARMKTSLSKLECIALSAYLGGRSYHEIAQALRMTPKQIDNALQRAKRKMKGRLARSVRERA